jgi:SM-20-related protein
MMTDTSTLHEHEQFESLIQGFMDNQFGLCDNFVSSDIIDGLAQMLLSNKSTGLMHPAGVGKRFDFQKNTEVRGDLIKWIENHTGNFFEQYYIKKVERFIQYLNETCYTSINSWEFHYANYEVGSFYKRHLDQFKTDKGRKFSLVLYLNKSWTESDGGLLAIYLADQSQHDFLPFSGRLVFFKSDQIEHEVYPSTTRERMSIAGWLKSV